MVLFHNIISLKSNTMLYEILPFRTISLRKRRSSHSYIVLALGLLILDVHSRKLHYIISIVLCNKLFRKK